MKVLVIIASLLLVAVVAAKEKKCKTSDDCGKNECCVRLFIFRSGKCKPLAGEGEGCELSDDAIMGSHLLRCPCQSGLSCEPEEIIRKEDMIIKNNVRCVKEGQLTTAVDEEIATEGPSE